MKNDAVFNLLPEEELLAQLAEECSEAAKAALKLRRARDGVNPTPAPSCCLAVSWTMTTPAICVMRSATGWSRSWSRSSPAGSTA